MENISEEDRGIKRLFAYNYRFLRYLAVEKHSIFIVPGGTKTCRCSASLAEDLAGHKGSRRTSHSRCRCQSRPPVSQAIVIASAGNRLYLAGRRAANEQGKVTPSLCVAEAKWDRVGTRLHAVDENQMGGEDEKAALFVPNEYPL